MKALIVGCGGTAGWLVQGLIRFIPAHALPRFITLMDKDVLEERNIDRQLFHVEQVGEPKSEALRLLVGRWLEDMALNNMILSSVEEWFMDGYMLDPGTLVFCCADNHRARRAILESVDTEGTCSAIICGNEYEDAEAYIYFPRWKGTPMDPRVYYPEILTEDAGDPSRAEACTGEIQVANPQLALANMSAASCGLHLFYSWFISHWTQDMAEFLPVQHKTSQYGFSTINSKQLMAEHALRSAAV